MCSRRDLLSDVQIQPSTHAGLWLDKFLPSQKSDGTKGLHIKCLEWVSVPDGYAKAFERRKRALVEETARPEGFLCLAATATTLGRAIVGLGQRSVLEVGIALDHTWGVPYLPGSSLKGIAAWAARQSKEPSWHEGGEDFLALFGDTDETGAVRFLDAWWKPGPKLPIYLDTMTVHHPEYYQARGELPAPSDTDSPTPIAFASVSGEFEVLLEGPHVWVDAAAGLLKRGLAEHGIGAKTAAGYGRMELKYSPMGELAERKRQEEEARKREFVARVARVTRQNAAQEVPEILRSVPEEWQREFALSIKERLTEKWLKERGNKEWVQRLNAAADGEPSTK